MAPGSRKASHYDRATAKRTEVSEGTGDGPDYTIPRVFPNSATAQRACKAQLGDFGRAKKHFTGSFKTGDNRAKPGAVLVSKNFGDDDDGEWTIKKVTHSYSNGYVTKFEAQTK